MNILTLRTDKPEAELGLYGANERLEYMTWTAHRQLAETLHTKLIELLQLRGMSTSDIEAIVCYKGPGSFTGLRIGLSVANALAGSLRIPIVGIEGEDGWLEKGMQRILSKEDDSQVLPEYGSPVHITSPRK